MVEDNLKKICLKALKKSFPNLEVVDMVILQTYRHDELKDDWVKDSHTFFIQLKKNETGVDILFQTHDAIDKLRRLNLLELDGANLCVPPIDKALKELRSIWCNMSP